MLQLLVSFTWETPRMSINLIESERRSQGSLGGTLVSIALHASLISLAVYATANAGEAKVAGLSVSRLFVARWRRRQGKKHDAEINRNKVRSRRGR